MWLFVIYMLQTEVTEVFLAHTGAIQIRQDVITKAINGFLMTQRQVTLKDVCG